jgi:hypothetical protein
MLGWALGINPFKDVFQSTRRGHFRGERCVELEGLVSCLSAGPIAPGDEIGYVNKSIVNAVCRNDGLLLKPDRPLTPVDLMFTKHDTYYICDTESHHGDFTWYYLLTINLWPERKPKKEFKLEDLQIDGKFYAYDWFVHEGLKINGSSQIVQSLKFEQYKYRILAPMLECGVAIIGDITKYATMNDKTFKNLESDAKHVNFTVDSILGEKITILLYSELSNIEVSIDNDVYPLKIDEKTHIGQIELNFVEDGKKMIQINV